MARYHKPGLILFFLIMATLAGASDFNDAVLEKQAYCENITTGAWPDYKGNAGEICASPVV